VEFEALATITPGPGTEVSGWTLSMTADGAEILSVTTGGLNLAETTFFDFAVLAVHKDDPGRKGAICALHGIGYPRTHGALPSTVPSRVLRLEVAAAVPAAGERRAVTLRHEDGFRTPSSEPVQNLLGIGSGFVPPTTSVPATIEIRGGDGAPFRRGDANSDARVDIGDAIFGFNFLFRGGPTPVCERSLDASGDDLLNIADALYLVHYVFGGGPPPLEPFANCGVLAFAAALSCSSHPPCE
jgi:hypothetical protein